MSFISPSKRLIELGIVIPPPPTPAGNYVHAVRAGNLVFLAGKADGPFLGKVGLDVSVPDAYAYARQTGNLLLLSKLVRIQPCPPSFLKKAFIITVNAFLFWRG